MTYSLYLKYRYSAVLLNLILQFGKTISHFSDQNGIVNNVTVTNEQWEQRNNSEYKKNVNN